MPAQPSSPRSTPAASPADAPPRGWPLWGRRMASVLLILHLTAIFASPWAGPPPASLLAGRVAGWFEPYLLGAFLNHGYRFFAPNPGPSHVVRYEIERADGGRVAGRFPHVDEHRPRLLYHRHLMLSETVYSQTELPPPAEVEAGVANLERRAAELETRGYPAEAAEVRREGAAQRASYDAAVRHREALLAGVAADLLRRHGGTRVRLWVQAHTIPDPAAVRTGRKLSDPELYQERYLGQWEAATP